MSLIRIVLSSCAAFSVAISLVGCGGTATEIMPSVKGDRLDSAQATLDAAGIKKDSIDIKGGGTFGVIDESNWQVCNQTPEPGKAIDSTVILYVNRSCPLLQTSTPTPVPSPPPVEQPSATAETDDVATETFIMPKLVGKNLQVAQDQLQARGSYVLDQEDASGLNRFQVLDSNWKVCRQKPQAGKKVGIDQLVTLGSVKLEESC